MCLLYATLRYRNDYLTDAVERLLNNIFAVDLVSSKLLFAVIIDGIQLFLLFAELITPICGSGGRFDANAVAGLPGAVGGLAAVVVGGGVADDNTGHVASADASAAQDATAAASGLSMADDTVFANADGHRSRRLPVVT